MKRILIVGATGDVGQGIVAAALNEGCRVAAAGRSAEKLAKLKGLHADAPLTTLAGDIADEAGAETLWTQAESALGGVDVVVVAVNAPNTLKPMLEWDVAGLRDVFDTNVMTHFVAAKTFVPRLGDDGVFIGIGGGTADFVIPKMGQVSMGQAALRMMYKAIARDYRNAGPAVRELMIISMVNGESKRDKADESWVTDLEVGAHVCAIMKDPNAFAGPVLTLKTRDEVGRPPQARS